MSNTSIHLLIRDGPHLQKLARNNTKCDDLKKIPWTIIKHPLNLRDLLWIAFARAGGIHLLQADDSFSKQGFSDS